MTPQLNNTVNKEHHRSCNWVMLFIVFFVSCKMHKEDNKNTSNLSTTLKNLYKLDIYRARVADSLKYLIPILDTILEQDQRYRYGMNNDPRLIKIFQEHTKEIKETDSLNMLKVMKILDWYGWLGYKRIGINENLAIFYVLQHAPLSMQEKYLPAVKLAVNDKRELPQRLAMLEDRVSLRRNGFQIYGSQVFYYKREKKYYLSPLTEPDSVIERRYKIGLDSATFPEYLKSFHISWNPKQYKEELPRIRQLYSELILSTSARGIF
ncbi:MAG: hypothetical protein JWN76_3571 [Chitinophagaceae bacterium]|nr:hypothetical protein [Chitinophagaceae bacterium]